MLPRISEEITFRKLEILITFLESGSLARAAERLGTSAVSVHRALHSLEAGTRCALFRLEGRNLQPTDAAHALADVAREILQRMDEGINATRAIAGYGAERIRIGSLYSLTSGTVPSMIMALKARKPEVQAELILGSNSDLIQRLRDGTLDAAVMGLPESAPELETHALFDDDVFFVAPAQSPYAGQAAIDLRDCAEERFVSLQEGFVTYSRFVDAFRIAGFEPQIVMKTNDIFSLMNLVGGGIGCTLLPGRVRAVLPPSVRLIPLQERYAVRQTIALCFLRARERDPNLLALLAASRTLRLGGH